ncbi:MAG TPA: translation elongation factor Ts [bacterium]|nr:translation elongation factor Ts [bacterium]
MAISASQVMELRAATGAGMMDCKKALEEMGGDMDAAKDYLRKKGIAIAQKKSSRETNEGGVAIRIADDKKSAAIVQLACETDFVARNEAFTALLERLTAQVLAKGEAGLAGQALVEGKGTVEELVTESIAKLGENLQLVAAARVNLPGEGTIGGYVHSNQKIGVLVSVTSDKPVAGDVLDVLAKDVAMHVAASQVAAVREDEIDPAVLAKEKEIYAAQALESGKPQEIVDKMVQGRIAKFVKEVSLLEQPFVKDPERTIKQLVAETGKAAGATLAVDRFVKLQF